VRESCEFANLANLARSVASERPPLPLPDTAGRKAESRPLAAPPSSLPPFLPSLPLHRLLIPYEIACTSCLRRLGRMIAYRGVGVKRPETAGTRILLRPAGYAEQVSADGKQGGAPHKHGAGNGDWLVLLRLNCTGYAGRACPRRDIARRAPQACAARSRRHPVAQPLAVPFGERLVCC
jgi:hypothetical protein